MVKLGDTAKGYSLEYKSHGQYIFMACLNCGKEHWVETRKGEPRTTRCFECASHCLEHHRRISISNKISHNKLEVRLATSVRVKQYYKEHPKAREALSIRTQLQMANRNPEHEKIRAKNHSKMMKTWYRNNPHPSLGKKRTSGQCNRISIAHIGLQALEKHPRWLGGKSFEPYTPAFGRRIKDKIRSNYNYICQICSKTTEVNGQKLDMHHINHNKADSTLTNLIPLCHSCNSGKVEGKAGRPFWEAKFKLLKFGEEQVWKLLTLEEMAVCLN